MSYKSAVTLCFRMEYINSKNQPSPKNVQSLSGIVCFKIREARGSGWLSLNGIRLRQLPSDIFTKLKHVKHLYVSGCRLQGIVTLDIAKLQNLVVLDLSDNRLTGLPASSLLYLRKLQTLDISDNKFTGLPHTIDQLFSLRELNVAQNSLVALPNDLGNLKRLEILNVSFNLLREVPAKLFTGGLACSLLVLKIQANHLDRLPRELGMLRSLEELDVRDNNLCILPVTSKSLLKLQVLLYTGNPWAASSITRTEAQQRKGEPGKLKGSYGVGALATVYNLIYSV